MFSTHTKPQTPATHAATLLQQGNYEYLSGNLEQAIAKFREALNIDPKTTEALYKIGLIQFRLGQITDATESLKKCIALDRKNTRAQLLYGRLLRERGDLDGSLRSYRLTLKQQPDNLDAIAGIAAVHEYHKDFAKAMKTIEPYCKPTTPNAQIAILLARICHKVNRCNLAVKYLDACLADNTITDKDTRSFLYYSLGDIYDRLQQFDSAFEAYRNANDCRKLQYDEFRHAKQVDLIKQTFGYDFMLRRTTSGNECDRPIFIIGMPRSGTTLTEQILASHPDVYGAGELTAISHIAKSISSKIRNPDDFKELYYQLDKRTLADFAQNYLTILKKHDTDSRFVTDKMPHNYLHLGLISMLFPNSRVIHCTRNPLDTCLSIYCKTFNDSHDYATSLDALAHHYRSYHSLMQHWEAVLPLKIHEVKYENLVNDFHTEVQALLGFCDLEWDDRCLKFHKTQRHVATASEDQVTQPLYTSSVNRWRHYEKHIQSLIDQLIEFVS